MRRLHRIDWSAPFATCGATALIVFAALTAAGRDAAAADEPADRSKPTEHEVREIERWTVHVDKRLLAEPHLDLGTRAVRLLGDRALREQLAQSAQRTVSDRYTVEAVCARMADVYREVLSE